MNKKLKKNLIEFAVIAAIFGGLYVTGLHTEVFGFLQRGILATGIMDPKLDAPAKGEEVNMYPDADFNLNLINSQGEKINLADYRGKVIFINMWATWCPPCVAEMPGIEKLYRDVQDDEDIMFVMLSLDHRFQKAVDYVEKKEFSFEIYETVSGMPDMYYTQSIPTTFVINAEGKLVLTHIGMGDFNTAEFKEFLLAQK